MEYWLLIRILCVCCMVGLSLNKTLDQSVEHMTDMLDGYDKRHRPVLDQSEAVQVNITFEIVAIQDFNEVEEKFSIVSVVVMQWFDEKLQWNPASYGWLFSQTFNADDIWYPTLILANPFDKIKALGDDWLVIRVYSNGFAYFSPGDVFKSTCSVDTTYYPFDTQSCSLMFLSWGFFSSEIRLKSALDHAEMNYFSENGEWDLIETSAYDTSIAGGSDAIYLVLKIRRKPLFLLINVILPIIFMIVINILVFALPSESGERVSYAVTVLLALAVFLTLVGDNLPKTSQPMAVLSYFLMICLCISTMICVCTILNLRIYFKSDDVPVPTCIALVTRLLTCTNVSSICKARNKIDVENCDIKMINEKDKTKMKKEVPTWIPDAEPDIAVTWKNVSSAIDVICITVFLLAIVITVSVYLSILVNNTTNL